ncbi:MAG: cytochrome c biogenesis protein ResB [Vampirovibrio sp.]
MAKPRSTPSPKPPQKATTVWAPWKRLAHQLYTLMASMEWAVVLLITLATFCVLGSFIPQESLVPVADIQRQFGDATPYLQAMGFFNIFYSPWFLGLDALFFLSIVVGSFRWLRPAWRAITLKTWMNAQHIQACHTHKQMAISAAIPPHESMATLRMALEQKGFHVTPSTPKHPWSLYAQRGSLGRVGPMLTHLGIAMTLLCTLYGAFTNFTAQVTLTPQESFYLAEAEHFQSTTTPPWWFGRIPEWKTVIKAFDIEFQPHAATLPKQFTTHLDIIDLLSGEKLASGTTSVNHPFYYDGVTFYQAQFSPTTLHQIRINNQPLQIDASERLAGRPYAVHRINATTRLFFFPLGRFTDGLPENRLHVLLEKNGILEGYGKGFKESNHNLLSLAEGQTAQRIGTISVAYDKAIMATGLQIKSAPEVPYLYLSLLILSLGCLLSFVPHHQVWFALHTEEGEGLGPPTALVWYAKAKKQRPALETSLKAVVSKMPALVFQHP